MQLSVNHDAVKDGLRQQWDRMAQATKRDAAWLEMKERLRIFETGTQWIGPNELLLTAARR